MAKKYCIDCGKKIKRTSTRCQQCAPKIHARTLARREKLSAARKEFFKNPQNRLHQCENAKKLWADPNHRQLIKQKMVLFWSNPENRIKLSKKTRARYQEQINHIITSIALKKKWQEPEFRAKHAGYKNPFYIDGKYCNLYAPGLTKSLKREIRTRDNFKCQNCEQAENGIALHVHHIDYNKKNHAPENLISLCKPCHDKTLVRKDRIKWQVYYQNILKNKDRLFEQPLVKEILAG